VADGSADASASYVADTSPQVLLDFDPAYLALAPGQQQVVLVRETSASGFPGGTISIRFDPAVAAAVAVRPILGGANGVADSHIDNGRAVITLPAAPDATGTRAVAEITLRGMSAGRSALAFDPVAMEGTTVTLSQSVVDVR
jgi:hypothetical protein